MERTLLSVAFDVDLDVGFDFEVDADTEMECPISRVFCKKACPELVEG